MLCLAGMKKDGRDARGTESRGNVHGYLPGFAHSAGHQLAFAAVNMLHNELDGLFISVGYRNVENSLRFFFQKLLNRFNHFNMFKFSSAIPLPPWPATCRYGRPPKQRLLYTVYKYLQFFINGNSFYCIFAAVNRLIIQNEEVD